MSEPMGTSKGTEQRGGEAPATAVSEAPFHRLLVAVDGTEAAGGADGVAREWAERFGAAVERIELSGARNAEVVRQVADAAAAFGADVIVLGCDHRRLARHRLSHSLRERLTRATDLPVLVVPGASSPARFRVVGPARSEEAGSTEARRHAHV